MTAFQAYAAGFGMILLDPATMTAAGRVWARLRGIRRAGISPLRVLSAPFPATVQRGATFKKNVSVRTASKKAGKVQTNETA